MAQSLENKPLRLIVQRGRSGRDWSARLDSEPGQACGGPTVVGAIHRWLKLNRDRFPGPYATVLNQQESTPDRRVVLLTATTRCPECGGVMKIISFIERGQREVVERCACAAGWIGAGRGRIVRFRQCQGGEIASKLIQ